MYSTLVLIVCAILYGGVLIVLYQRNADLSETVKGHEEKIRELEKYLNPTEKDSMIRTRLSTTETRDTALDRVLKTQAADLDMVTKQMQLVLAGNPQLASQQERKPEGDTAIPGLADAGQLQAVTDQVIFVNDRVTNIAERVDAVINAQNNLARKSMIMEGTNICIFTSTDACPPRMQKAATFGIIAHLGASPIPPGYYIGGAFNDNGWNWIHGGMCCME